MARTKDIDPDSILDAAERVTQECGVQGLTLELVATEAGISKGGLTYTYPTKEALLVALMDRFAARFHARVMGAIESHRDEPFPEFKAYLEVIRWSDQAASTKTGPILAAIVHAPDALKASRDFNDWLLSKMSANTVQGRRARMAFYATKGVFLLEGFGLLSMSLAERKALIEDFISVANEPG